MSKLWRHINDWEVVLFDSDMDLYWPV